MKKVSGMRFFALLLGAICTFPAFAKKEAKEKGEFAHPKQVLVVGLHDNVKSNYYYDGMIAEETGIQADSIDFVYNDIIAENIVAATAKDKDCRFIAAENGAVPEEVLEKIKVNGEEEDCYSDLSSLSTEELQDVLDGAVADYLLVLNQHYLRWQEQPLRTLFHTVSYTLYDKNKNELMRGNNFFTCMKLEKPDKVKKISKKSSSKIATSVVKLLDEEE